MRQQVNQKQKAAGMNHLLKSLTAYALLSLFLLPFSGLFAQLGLQGSEFQVNTTTANNQGHPAISMDANGNFIIVWESDEQDGSDYGIYAQLYDSTGAAIGTEIDINSNANDKGYGQRIPDVAMDPTGDFVVIWQADSTDGSGHGIYYRRFNADGSAKAVDSRANSASSNNQKAPQIASNYDGDFIMVWMDENADSDSYGIYRRRVDNSGAVLESPVQVNVTETGLQGMPAIAMDSVGNHVIAWQSQDQDGDGQGIFAQVYDETGTVTITEFQVNTTTAGNQQAPAVGMDYNGNFVIAWTSWDQDGNQYGIYAQRYNASGVAQGSEFLVNSTTGNDQTRPNIAMSKEGNFVISWTSYGTDGNRDGVYLQAYRADGSTYGSQTRVNTRTTDFQQFGKMAWYADSTSLVATWQDGLRNATTTHDGDEYGVFAQIFAIKDTTPPTAVCQNITTYLNGSGSVSITGADLDGGSDDNVGVTTLIANTSSFACADTGANSVILTVGDAAGNTAVCGSFVIVIDSTRPTAVCQDITLYLDGTGNASLTGADLDNGSSDNCGVNTYTASVTNFTCSEAGNNTVTLTVEDVSSNKASCNSTVTVQDTVSPNAVCQDITVYLDGTGNVTVTGADVDNGSTDNCSGSLSYGLSQSAFTCSDIGANSETLTVTDPGSNISTCTTVINVADSSSPTAVCQNITIYLDGGGNASITAADVDGGSSDNCGVNGLSATPTSFTCTDVGNVTVTLTVDDAQSNSSNCTATVTVSDSTAPTVSCQNTTVYLDGTGSASLTFSEVNSGSSDNCSIVDSSLSQTSFGCSDLGTQNVTVQVEDGSANVGSCIASVVVSDTTAPTAVCQDLTVYLDGSGNASLTSGDVDNGSSDNCSVDSLNLDISSFTCSNVGANTVTLTVKDTDNNSGTCTSTVTVIDSTAPTAACQNVTVYLDGTGNGTVSATDADGGSNDICGVGSISISTSSVTCSNIGTTISDTLVVTDVNTNTASCTFTISVADTTGPTAVCTDITVQLDGGGTASIVAADVDGGSSDNCGVTSSSVSVSSFTCANVGGNSVVLTVSDTSANSSSCTATVTVQDTVAPAAICQDLTVYLSASGNASITSGDVDNGSSDNCSVDSLNLDISSFTCSNTGPNTVTLTVKDTDNNAGTCTSTVTVVDSTTPTAVCQNVTVYLDGTGNATVLPTVADGGSTDACGVGTLSVSNSAFSCGDAGTSIADTLVVTDVNSNIASCTFTWTVEDTLAPNIVCQNTTVYLDGTGAATLTAADVDGGTTDNCSATPSLSVSTSSFNCGNTGSNTVTLTASDAIGNTDSCSATVTVQDTIAPQAVCQDVTTYLDGAGSATIQAGDLDNGSSDACGVATIAAGTTSFSCGDLGANTVILTITDVNTNSSTCTSTVTVLDTLAPAAVCAADTIYLDGTGQAVADLNAIGGNSTDNCGVDSLSLDITDFDCADIGDNTVQLTVLDASSNSDVCSAVITVLDTVAPTVSCQDFTLYLDINGAGSITPPDVTTGPPTDNCPAVGAPILSQTTFVRADTGTNQVTVTVTDSSGNTAQCVSVVTVVDSFVTGIEEELIANGFSFRAYPNPTNGDLFVEVICESCTYGEPTQIMVTSMLGEVLYREELGTIVGSVKTRIDMRDWSQGAYVLSVQQGGKTVNRRVVRY